MLNDADGHGSGDAGETPKNADALFSRLKWDVKADYNSRGQVNWRRGASEDFDFEAGEQLNEDDKAILQDARRPIVTFNRVGTTVDAVAVRKSATGRKSNSSRAGSAWPRKTKC